MRIVKLLPSERVPGRWLAYLEDEAILRLGEGDVVSFGLYAGMELDRAALDKLETAARLSRGKEKAVSLLAARPLSRKELIDKLTARPHDREQQPLVNRDEAEEIAAWLEDLGYLDDASYARMVAEHYAAKGYGPRKIRDELYRRGISRERWEEALEGCESQEAGIDAFLEKKFRGRAPEEKELKRAADALARRGYRWEEIRSGLRRYGASMEGE